MTSCFLSNAGQIWALVLAFATSTIIYARRTLLLNRVDRI